MPAIRVTLSVFDDAKLDDVLNELQALAKATNQKQSVNYNGKWMHAEPEDTIDQILRRYAGEKQIPTVVSR